MKKISPRKLVLVLSDMFIISISVLLSNHLLGYFDLNALSDTNLDIFCVLSIFLCFAALYMSGAYSKMWRYFNYKDYLSCIAGMIIGSGIATVITYFIYRSLHWEFVLLQVSLGTIGIILFRFVFRKTFLVLIDSSNDKYKKRTLIIGAGEACKIILKEIENSRTDVDSSTYEYLPVGIIDDNPQKLKTGLRGVRVLGNSEDIIRICKEKEIDIIIFAIPSCTESEKRYILDLCSETSCKIKIVPSISKMLDEKDSKELISQINDIKVEDLLGREPITFTSKDTREFINEKICMITGGGGSIGSELTRQIAKYNPAQIIILDIYENNAYDIQQELVMEYGSKLNIVTLIASVRDYEKMEKVYIEYKPNIVFHAAAHKHVPLMETSPEEAVKNNIIGTYNMAVLAKKYNVEKFVMISTDKAVNPTNVMGASKRCCEMIMEYVSQDENSKTEFVTTRFGNVLGSNGSVIPLFKRQIENGKEITVTHPEIIRYFMTIPEAVSLVLQAASMAHGGEIFVLDMGAPVKILTLAENLIRMYGKVPYKDIKIKFTGLRPGEKLYEELLMNEEGLTATKNKKIFIGKQIPLDVDIFVQKLDCLRECAKVNNSDDTIKALNDIVPTFHHQTNN